MHNLHLVVVKADSGEEACSEVESTISDWGNENNWRSFGGAVSEDNEVYVNEDARWQPEEGDTVKGLQAGIQATIDETLKLKDGYGNDISHYFKSISDKNFDALGHLDYYKLGKWATAMSSIRGWEKGSSVHDKFDILKDEHLEWQFDEYGVTNIADGDDGEGKLWIVFVDMHS